MGAGHRATLGGIIEEMCGDWKDILIEAVRRRPVLWDKSHIGFKDGRGVKWNNWVDVATEVTLAVDGFTTTDS